MSLRKKSDLIKNNNLSRSCPDLALLARLNMKYNIDYILSGDINAKINPIGKIYNSIENTNKLYSSNSSINTDNSADSKKENKLNEQASVNDSPSQPHNSCNSSITDASYSSVIVHTINELEKIVYNSEKDQYVTIIMNK